MHATVREREGRRGMSARRERDKRDGTKSGCLLFLFSFLYCRQEEEERAKTDHTSRTASRNEQDSDREEGREKKLIILICGGPSVVSVSLWRFGSLCVHFFPFSHLMCLEVSNMCDKIRYSAGRLKAECVKKEKKRDGSNIIGLPCSRSLPRSASNRLSLLSFPNRVLGFCLALCLLIRSHLPFISPHFFASCAVSYPLSFPICLFRFLLSLLWS